MDHPPQLRAFPGWNQGSGAARPQRRLAELSLGSAGWRLRGNRGRGCGEVQSPLPRRTCNSGRFSSKPCFNMCVNLELSEKCFLCWTRGLGLWLLRENRFCVCCMKNLGKVMMSQWGVCGLAYVPGQTHANICKCMHIHILWTNQKNKGQSSGCVLFLDGLCPALEPMGFISVSCLTPGHGQTREGDVSGGPPW